MHSIFSHTFRPCQNVARIPEISTPSDPIRKKSGKNQTQPTSAQQDFCTRAEESPETRRPRLKRADTWAAAPGAAKPTVPKLQLPGSGRPRPKVPVEVSGTETRPFAG